jgi:hypothetical protein
MWIVRLAPRRPYTTKAILIAIIGGLSSIPMAGVIWTYKGVSPDDMTRPVLFVSERATTTTFNNRAHAFGGSEYFLGRS